MKRISVSAVRSTHAQRALGAALTLGLVAACGSSSSNKGNSVPPTVENGDTQVSATVECGDKSCSKATIFVSACDVADPSHCYDVKPAGEKGGNTYIVALSKDDVGTSATGLTRQALDEVAAAPGDAAVLEVGAGAGDGTSSTDAGASDMAASEAPKGELVEGASCKAAQEGKKGLPVDLLFVIDTTSSMGTAISGVVSSIDSFVNRLAKNNVDVRVGGIAFGDKAPLATCTDPSKPFAPFTKKYGAGTDSDSASFNYWLGGLSASYCGDGGGDGPENALDAIEFALGNDPIPDDEFKADAFAWNEGSLRVMIVITDVTQHQKSDGETGDDGKIIAHFNIDEVAKHLAGRVVAHVVAPDNQCSGTPFAFCTCNKVAYECDAGCACDAMCPIRGCAADKTPSSCDDETATCDIDCAGYRGSSCDKTAGLCDFAEGSTTKACASDYDCRGGATAGEYAAKPRRCVPITGDEKHADAGLLAYRTHGSLTPLPYDGNVDLTKLPLTGILSQTSLCDVSLPADTAAVRVVYKAGDHAGEVTVPVEQ